MRFPEFVKLLAAVRRVGAEKLRKQTKFQYTLRQHVVHPIKSATRLLHTVCYVFYPRPVLDFGYCRCLRPSVCPSIIKFVRAITHHPFKLGSPNLDYRCKTPWLRSLLFFCFVLYYYYFFLGGQSILTFKVKFNLKVKIWACPYHIA